MTGLDYHFPSTKLKAATTLLAKKRLSVSAQYSWDGLQTDSFRSEHGKFFAVRSDTKNTVKVKKKPTPLAKLNRDNLDIETERNYPSWNFPKTLSL